MNGVLRFGGGVGRFMDVEHDEEGVGSWCWVGASGRVMGSDSTSEGVCGLGIGDEGAESNVTVLVSGGA